MEQSSSEADSCFRSSKCILLIKYCQGDHIKEVEMGMACGIHGNKEVYMQDFIVKT